MHSHVGPYRIVERLGAGGMGEVFLAEDTRLGRLVALKRLSDTSVGDAVARSRIMREAGAAATVNHPNIAGVYDVLDADGRAHIVMEYVPGETLASQLQRGPLPLDRVVQVGLQLCDALIEAHAHGVVHRDLKPANVRVTPEGRVKVLDFGLALRPVRAPVAASDPIALYESLALGEGQVIGTPVYMAPEVLLGEAADARSDIYSLGVTLLELASGRPAFEGRNFMSVALAVLTEPQPPVRELVPGGLGEIIATAMARDREQRYQSVQALRRDLASLSAELTDLPTGVVQVPAPPSTRPSHAPRMSRRAWTWTATASAALAAILTALLTGAMPGNGVTASSVPVLAVLSMPTVTDNQAHANLGVGVAAELGGYLANTIRQATIVDTGGSSAQVQTAGVGAAGRELGATYVVPVFVQVQGRRAQLQARLVRVSTHAVLGSVTERGLLDEHEFFEMQQRLAERLAMLVASQLQLPSAAMPPRQPAALSLGDFADYSAAIAMLDRRFVPGNVDEAQRLLEGVVARSPGFAAAHAELASAYATQFRERKEPAYVERSLEAARRAVALDGMDPRGLTALALAYELAGRDTEAVRTLRDGLDRQPRSDALRAMLGDILVRGGDVEAGLAELREAVRLRPDYAENQAALGLALYTRGRFEDALAPFTRAVELTPADPLAHQRLGAAYHQLGQLEPAVRHYREAARLGGPASVFANLGTILYRQGSVEEALANYDEALKLRPGSHQTWRSRGDALARLGRHEEARASWQRAAELAGRMLGANASDASARAFLAVCRAKLGEHDVARAEITRALRDAPGNPDVLYRAAVVHTLAGRLDEGRTFRAEAVKAGYSTSEAAVDDDLHALGPFGE